jgi:hypothetical protein
MNPKRGKALYYKIFEDMVLFVLFIRGIFNNTVSGSDYVAWNDRMT